MFKSIFSVFKKSPPKIIPVTPELLHKRSKFCSNLKDIYQQQITLLSDTFPKETVDKISILQYYTSLLDQYKNQLSQINNEETINNIELTEESFSDLLLKQLDSTVSELEEINLKINSDDLKSLNDDYSEKIDLFFFNYHINRISISYALKEYLYPKPLLQIHQSSQILKDSIKLTSRMLTLNDYPVPKFEISKENSGADLKVYCVSPHIVHIIFELFKNATIPSITHIKPIKLSIYEDPKNNDLVVFKIKDRGGGMPNSTLQKIWQFHYTTTNDSDRDPIHGFGMGLPLCKVFAKFNNASLDLINREGDGVTILIKIPKAKK